MGATLLNKNKQNVVSGYKYQHISVKSILKIIIIKIFLHVYLYVLVYILQNLLCSRKFPRCTHDASDKGKRLELKLRACIGKM